MCTAIRCCSTSSATTATCQTNLYQLQICTTERDCENQKEHFCKTDLSTGPFEQLLCGYPLFDNTDTGMYTEIVTYYNTSHTEASPTTYVAYLINQSINIKPSHYKFTYGQPTSSYQASSISGRKGKPIPVQPWTGPEGSRRLRFPDFKTIGT